MMDAENMIYDRLERLLLNNQFELVDYEGFFAAGTGRDCKAVYLMNDAAESFIVFKNARYTGTYDPEYEGDITYILDRNEPFLRVNQGEAFLMLFFDGLEFEVNLYNYGEMGHFWLKGYENLRNLEYQVAAIREKEDYLGPQFLSDTEKKIASLREFAPLNYISYPSSKLQYTIQLEDPYTPSKEAVDFFMEICAKVGDDKLYRLTGKFGSRPTGFLRRKIAALLRRSSHKAVTDYLYDMIKKEAAAYPERIFAPEERAMQSELLAAAGKLKKQYEEAGEKARIYREEPFLQARDEVKFGAYVMLIKDGFFHRKIKVIQVQ